MRLFCGVDGGGSKTMCVVGDERGRVLGVGVAGPANPSIVGVEGACEAVRKAVVAALREASGARASVVFAALAGAGSWRRGKTLVEALSGKGPWDRVEVGPDALAALMSVTLGKPGVVVIAGTGSVALSTDGEGNVYKVGGWGWLVDDEGGGFYLGREGIRRALMAYDGRGPATLLAELVERALGASSLEDVVDRIALGELGVREIAMLAPTVIEAYRRGDEVAAEILRDACRSLAVAAAAAAKKAGLKGGVKVGVCGGVFEGSAEFRAEFEKALKKLLPEAEVVSPAVKPAVGALLLAYRCGGVQLKEEVVDTVLRTALSRGELRYGGGGG